MSETTTPVRPAKDKRAKFENIATARTKRAVKAIRILARMGGKNRYSYEFDSTDIAKIVATLSDEVEALRHMMSPPGRQLDVEFDLK